MTLIAGIDLHATLRTSLAAAGFPAASVKQGGRVWPGRGYSDNATGVFVPDDSGLRPLVGDRFSYGGQEWVVSAFTGSEDAWEFTLADAVQPLVADAEFDYEATGFPGGRFSILANASGGYEGRWRVDAKGWSNFAFTGSSYSGQASGDGFLEVDVWKLDRTTGEASAPIRKTAFLI